MTCDDGTDIWWKDNDEGGKLQERTVNLDKRCRINVTFYPESCKTQVDAFILHLSLHLYMMDLFDFRILNLN